MAEITACPSCGKQNRVPATATGKPACAVCGVPLPWVVDATDETFGRAAWRTPVGASPHGIVADHQGNTVLAAVTGTNQVAVLDARHGTLLDRIAVAAGPAGMTIDQRTGRVFVGNQGAGVVAPSRRRADMADITSRLDARIAAPEGGMPVLGETDVLRSVRRAALPTRSPAR